MPRSLLAFPLVGACALLPADGTWIVPPGDVVSDGCGLYDAAPPGQSTVQMTHIDPTSFLLRFGDGDPVDCTRLGAAFTCKPGRQSLDLLVLTLDNEVTLEGVFVDGFHATGTIAADATCVGDACAELPKLGITLPCATELTWTARHEAAGG